MRIGSSEWREEMGRAAAGKTIASLACGGSGRTLRLWFVTGKQEMGTCSECHGTGSSGDGVPPGSITIIANKVVNTGTIGGEGDDVLRVEGPDVFKPKA
jgi:hypothetical protein